MSREPTEMELRVAKAVELSIDRALSQGGIYSDLVIARAAIRAMRPYTLDMYEAGCNAFSEEPGEAYEAMIDAASPEDK